MSVLLARPASAVQLRALYTASCQREIGIILNVTPRKIFLLNLQGEIVPIERYEVIYYATFLMDTVPISEVKNPQAVPLVKIKTFENGGLVDLVEGWPVDFRQDKIAILNLRGSEILIDRASIWQIDYREDSEPVRFQNQAHQSYSFAHPYAFSSCPDGDKKNKLYPQQMLNDPVSIKRELDRLNEGHVQIKRYVSDQQFYPVPEIYPSETTLGLWLMTGSRYGASTTRKNNFAPFLVNQFSDGPFGFQSYFATGSGPVMQGIHEETQTQITYRMKADYFHFGAMADPNLLLVGKKFNWSIEDLFDSDIRANEIAYLELGFDFGRVSFEFFPGSVANVGAKYADRFQQQSVSAPRVGIRYQSYRWLADLFAGGSSHSDGTTNFSMNLLRLNLEFNYFKNQRYSFSLISRNLSADAHDSNTAQPFKVNSSSLTLSAYGQFRFKRRYWAGGLVAVESVNIKSGINSADQSGSQLYPKIGTLISLSF